MDGGKISIIDQSNRGGDAGGSTSVRENELKQNNRNSKNKSTIDVDIEFERFGLYRDKDPMIMFYDQINKEEKIFEKIKKVQQERTGDESHIDYSMFLDNYMMKTAYHYRFNHINTSPGDLMSALKLPDSANLSNKILNLYELIEILNGRDFSKKGSVKNFKIREMSVSSINNNGSDHDHEVDKVRNRNGNLEVPSNNPSGSYVKRRSSGRGSKIYNLLAKNSEAEIDNGNMMGNLTQHLLVSMRQMKSKGLTLHDKKYEFTSPVSSAINASSQSQPKTNNMALFSGTKLSQINMPAGEAGSLSLKNKNSTKGITGGLKENFIIKSKILHSRVILIIEKKKRNIIDDNLINAQKDSNFSILYCPDMISLDCKSLEEIPFKFTDAQYINIKDREEEFFYFRVSCTSSI